MVSTIPPPNYGTVEAGRIYRSAYPSQENLPFLAGLGLKSILILVEGPHEATYSAWIKDNAKKLYTVPLPANKDGVQMQIKTIAMIIDILSDETNYPMLIHCNKGKHRTGCTVGAWRKLHGSSMHEILGEYRTYAGNKARPNDEVFLTKLNVPSLRDYMRHGSLHEEIDLGVIDPTTGRHYWPFRADHEMNARVKISRSLVPVASESSAPVPSVTVVPVSAASLVPVKRTNGATSPKMKACRLET
ncbi:hypothetical protein EJ05DRAFT_437209 [Pseudovirgaria hyperparasitica]|uniref:Tyrosine phosphatase n=1 Tax=Pseudovirgaria hyperparasitica TaxID=470096 RepID=A0A6A6WCD1_9PEZI|nr:uncharacterized protein EJ05DRAFT_437209 [Pseudovirgaria hyperparasitica]KAF2759620.1 hypothetical protein EJ05DRAFT_437209 [Pseudovirgaria hyperparasitica]